MKATKRTVLSEKVAECKGDIKRLYKTFNDISGQKQENPMPEGFSELELSNKFADFFMGKIESIRDALKDCPKYVPQESLAPKFDNFNILSEEEVRKLIFSLASKSCELDILPAFVLKNVISSVLSPITMIAIPHCSKEHSHHAGKLSLSGLSSRKRG